MQYSFLGFSVSKMMELNLDMKDMAILRYFVDFRETGRMKAEVIGGRAYYWVNYNSMAEEMPYLELGKKTIMTRMLKLRDLGILVHYTKKEGGTFSFFAIGPKYIELISSTTESENKNIQNDETKEDSISKKGEGIPENGDGVLQNGEGVSLETDNGCPAKRTTKTNLLKDSSTKETHIKKYKKDIDEIVNYLNEVVSANYKSNSKNTVKLITARFNEGYEINDFKTVINKKAKEWKGTQFEQYLTPQTLFGNKFEQYLNQKIIAMKKSNNSKGKLRFDNFKGRDYDYDDLEKKLLGWD